MSGASAISQLPNFPQSDPLAQARHVHEIILVRHGRTAYNAEGRLQGQIDIPLDEVGRRQIRVTAEALRDLYVDRPTASSKQLVICSDLERAEQSAHAFADPLGLQPHPDVRLRERGFGRWEGLSIAELRERWPEDYRLWADVRGGELRHGAEPKAHVGRRGAEALKQWAALGDSDTTLFVFSHGSWIAETVLTMLGLPDAEGNYAALVSMRNAHWARLTALDRDDGSVVWRLADFNHGPRQADTDQWDRL